MIPAGRGSKVQVDKNNMCADENTILTHKTVNMEFKFSAVVLIFFSIYISTLYNYLTQLS